MNGDLILSLLAATVLAGTPPAVRHAGRNRHRTLGGHQPRGGRHDDSGGFFRLYRATAYGQRLAGRPGRRAGRGLRRVAARRGVPDLSGESNRVGPGPDHFRGWGCRTILGTPFVGVQTEGFQSFALPVLGQIPVLGPVFFQHNALVYVSYLLPPVLWCFFNRSSTGLALRAAGEYPAAVSAAGLDPVRLRWLGIFVGAFLVGVGGAYLSLGRHPYMDPQPDGGQGLDSRGPGHFRLLAAGPRLFGAWLFGGIMALQLRLQALGVNIPSSLMTMLPYALTVLALLWASWRGHGPRRARRFGREHRTSRLILRAD